MDRLSDLARDYLADFEVLTDARKEFEEALGAWWDELLRGHVRPALEKESGARPADWENRNTPGMYQCPAGPLVKDFYLEITDPRASRQRIYSVRLCAANVTGLRRRMRTRPEAFQEIEEFAQRPDVRVGPLDWNRGPLAKVDVQIRPDDPDTTASEVTDAARRVLRVVQEWRRIAKEAPDAGSEGSAPADGSPPPGGAEC